MKEKNLEPQVQDTPAESTETMGKHKQAKPGSVPPELRLPALNSLMFNYARNGSWKADTDKAGRKTGIIRRALANITFPIGGSITLTRTIWQERVKDRAANKFRDVFSLTVRDRYNVDYPSEAAEKAWSRWAGEVLADNGPFAQWQAELSALTANEEFDGRPRLVKTTDATDGEMSEFDALISNG